MAVWTTWLVVVQGRVSLSLSREFSELLVKMLAAS
jgi:hypothetical protein